MDDRSEDERLADQEKQAFTELHRANRAKQICEDELFVEAVKAVEADLLEAFRNSPLDNDALRRDARVGLSVLDKLQKNLRHHMETGTLAQHSLVEVEKRKGFLARMRA